LKIVLDFGEQGIVNAGEPPGGMHTVRGLGERRFGDVEEVEAVRNGVRRLAKLRTQRESLERGKRVNGDLV